ncbi:MAG: hypothetical protein CMF48_04945 [Legionellales bacterium]|nr:hypothetical protein [Legionellales bacterium]
MPKKLGYFAGSLVAGLVFFSAATPWLYGKRFEDSFNASVRNLNSMKGVTILSSKFSRGWRESEAKVNIEVINPALSSQPIVALLDLDIKHGPFVKLPEQGWHTAGAGLVLDEISINGRTVDVQMVALATKSHINWTIDLPAVRENDFEISKSKVRMISAYDFSHLQLNYDLPQSAWSRNNNHLTLQGYKMDLSIPLSHPNWDYFADIRSEIEHLSIDGDAFKVEGLNFDVENKPQKNENLLESDINLSFDSMVTNHERSGPLTVRLNTRNIPISFISAFEKRLDKIEDPQQAAALFLTKNDALKTLVAATPELRVSGLEYTIPEGTLKANANLVWGGEGVKPTATQLIDTLKLDADILAPRQLIYQVIKSQETEKLMAAMQQQELTLSPEQFDMEVEKATTASLYQMEFNKMLLREGDKDYRFNIKVLNGVVSLNGTPSFSLPD